MITMIEISTQNRDKYFNDLLFFKMTNSTSNMKYIDENAPVALSVKNIERDTLTTDDEPKQDLNGINVRHFDNKVDHYTS